MASETESKEEKTSKPAETSNRLDKLDKLDKPAKVKIWLIYHKPASKDIQFLETFRSRYEAKKALDNTLHSVREKIEKSKFRRKSEILRRKKDSHDKICSDKWERIQTTTETTWIKPKGIFRWFTDPKPIYTTKETIDGEYGIQSILVQDVASSSNSGIDSQTCSDYEPLMGEEYVEFVKTGFTRYGRANLGSVGISASSNLLKEFRNVAYNGESLQYLSSKLLLDLTQWILKLTETTDMPSNQEMELDTAGSATKPTLMFELIRYTFFLIKFSAFQGGKQTDRWVEQYGMLIAALNMSTSSSADADLDKRLKALQAEQDAGNRFFEEMVEFPDLDFLKDQQHQLLLDSTEKQVYDKYCQESSKVDLLPKTPLNLLKIIYAEPRVETMPFILQLVIGSQVENLSKKEHDEFETWIKEELSTNSRADLFNLLGYYYEKFGKNCIANIFYSAAAKRGNSMALLNLCHTNYSKKYFLDFASSDYPLL